MNLMDAADLYVNEAGRIRTPKSRITFMKTIATLDRYLGGGVDVATITDRQLTDWCLSGDNPAPGTIKKRRAHIRSMMAWLTWRGIVPSDPSSGLEFSVTPGTGVRSEGVWLDEYQISHVIMSCPDNFVGHRDRLILMLGFFCGLRAFEIEQIRWDDFSTDYTTIALMGKGDKPATVGLPSVVAAAFQAWRSQAPSNASAVLPITRFQFDAVSGEKRRTVDWTTPLGYEGIRVAVAKAGRRAGVKLRPHDMRRSFAGLLEAKGHPLTDIQRVMRHSNPGTTGGYLNKNPNKAVRITSALTIEGVE